MPARSIASPLSAPEQWAALFLRLALGAMYIAHALFKVLVLVGRAPSSCSAPPACPSG